MIIQREDVRAKSLEQVEGQLPVYEHGPRFQDVGKGRTMTALLGKEPLRNHTIL